MVKTQLYISCKDLPLSGFIQYSLKKDVNGLIRKKGLFPPSEKRIRDTWIGIYQEYTDLCSSDTGNAYLALIKQKTTLSNKIHILKMAIESLSMRRNEKLIKEIKKMGIKGSFSKKTFEKDLNKSIIQLKSMIGRLKKVEKNLLPFTSGSDMTENEYLEILIVLSKHQGYRIDADTTSVLDFINILNNFKKWQTPKK